MPMKRLVHVLMTWGVLLAAVVLMQSCTESSTNQTLADIDTVNELWYAQPADKWESALPVGNGRLGAMVFGRTDVEKIQFNEDTHWSGGPYSTTVKGGYAYLPEIQKLLFEGNYYQAHRLFGRKLMGYPVEQQKYQSTGDLLLKFASQSEVNDYSHRLDLSRAISTVSYKQDGVQFTREVFSTAVDQVIVVRLTADQPGKISFVANLNGYRNTAHSNYGTDYYYKDGYGQDGLILNGKSDDYLSIEGKLLPILQHPLAGNLDQPVRLPPIHRCRIRRNVATLHGEDGRYCRSTPCRRWRDRQADPPRS